MARRQRMDDAQHQTETERGHGRIGLLTHLADGSGQIPLQRTLRRQNLRNNGTQHTTLVTGRGAACEVNDAVKAMAGKPRRYANARTAPASAVASGHGNLALAKT